MALSRKNKRELKRLRDNTELLLDQQRDVIHNAGVVISQASHQARKLGSEELMPRVNAKLDDYRPQIQSRIDSAKRAADRVRVAITPAVATALAKTVTALDNIDARNAANQVETFGKKSGIFAEAKKQKKKRGAGLFVAGVGIAAAAAVGYAIWQAFRDEDEDMWVSSD